MIIAIIFLVLVVTVRYHIHRVKRAYNLGHQHSELGRYDGRYSI